MTLTDETLIERLRSAGLRPTRQRIALARMLYGDGDRHVTAEMLHAQAQAALIKVSLATVYNTLHQFVESGLLREVVAEPGRSYFDTNISDHHHFFHVDRGSLEDIEEEEIEVSNLPRPPDGSHIESVDIVIRVRDSG